MSWISRDAIGPDHYLLDVGHAGRTAAATDDM